VLLLVIIHNRLLFQGQTNESGLQFTEVKRQDLKVTLAASGTFTGEDSTSLRFKAPGKLAFVNIKMGDQVYTGEVLAGLDSRDISIQLQQAQNTLRDKQAALDKVLDDIHLFQYGNGGFSNIGSVNETMAQRQLRTVAEVARDNSFDSIRLAQVALSDTVLTSPISGVVTKANYFPGQVITATDTIDIVDFSKPSFEAEIDESDITKVSLGQKAEVTLNAYGEQVFPGIISEIIPQTKETTSGATVITVVVSLNGRSFKNISGLNGQVNIIWEEKANVLTIPIEALREDETVLVQTPDGLQENKVKVGLRSETEIEITEGLQEGQKVVTNPPSGPIASNRPFGGLFRSGSGRQ